MFGHSKTSTPEGGNTRETPTRMRHTKTKLIKRQMHGRASFALLRHRILLVCETEPFGKQTPRPTAKPP